ncbi:MAG: GNAT family N-acetyltransferase [Patescibacteria group bacterium]
MNSFEGLRNEVPRTPEVERCSVEVFDLNMLSWKYVGKNIMAVELSAFGEERSFGEETLENDFMNPENTIVILRDAQAEEIIGFTYAKPTVEAYPEDFPERSVSEDTAYIYDTALKKEYQGKGLVQVLIERLEGELAKKGYRFIERDSADYSPESVSKIDERTGAKRETYADKVRKTYGERIEREEKHDSEYGSQVFFRIRLKSPEGYGS